MVIHEANLVDYAADVPRGPGMESRTAATPRSPRGQNGVKVRGHTPFVTPWRTIQLADRIADLSPSVLALNLNPPNTLGDVSWIEADEVRRHLVGDAPQHDDVDSGPKHGATTAKTRNATSTSPRRTDSAACWSKAGTSAGMATGSRTRTRSRSRRPIRTTISPELAAVREVEGRRAHRAQRDVGRHRELRAPDGRRVRALSLARASTRSRRATSPTRSAADTRTTAQYMVRHYRQVIETAAKYGIMVDAHEPIHDTGERRT